MRARLSALVLAGAVLLGAPAARAVYTRSGDASVKATIAASGGITFTAKTADVRVADDGTSVTFAVPASALETGISMRDNHLRDHLEATKYPTITFSIVKADVKLPAPGASLEGTVGSSVTLHGVKKTESVPYSISAANGGYRVHVDKLVLHLSDYGIERPSFAGVTVKNDVAVAVDLPLNGG